MAKGDHLYVNCGVYSHHGIDCGDGTVIHLSKKAGKVEQISINKFNQFDEFNESGDEKTIETKEYYGKCDSPDVVVKRAKDRLDEERYNLAFYNCEHFAHYCKTGVYKSDQVNNAVKLGKRIVDAGVRGGIEFAQKEAAKAAMKSVDPISKVLINVGLKQAPKAAVAGRAAAGIANVGGVVSSIATDLLVDKILEDDEHMNHEERRARSNAKIVGKAGSFVGGLAGAGAGVAAASVVGAGGAIAIGVAAPAVLGVGLALGSYHLVFKEGDKKLENASA